VAFTVFVMAANGLLRYRDMYRQQAESQAWMRALLTTTIDGVITVDRTGVIHEFNLSAERIFGWTRDEIVGRNIRILMADTERSERDGLLNFLRTGDAAWWDAAAKCSACAATAAGADPARAGPRAHGGARPVRAVHYRHQRTPRHHAGAARRRAAIPLADRQYPRHFLPQQHGLRRAAAVHQR
jgi:hypothetical protein